MSEFVKLIAFKAVSLPMDPETSWQLGNRNWKVQVLSNTYLLFIVITWHTVRFWDVEFNEASFAGTHSQLTDGVLLTVAVAGYTRVKAI